MAPIRNFSIRRKVSGLGRRETVSEDDSKLELELELACTKGDVKAVKELLLRQKVNVRRQRSSDGCTLLHLAAKGGHEEVLISLLDVPDVQDISKVNHDGDTVVHLAAEQGSCDILKLLQKKVLPEDRDIFQRPNNIGQTPLHKAAGKGYIGASEYLLYYCGVPVDASDSSGNTALHLAAKSGCIEVIHFLLVKKGADFFSTNKRREWPLDLMDTPKIQSLFSDWEFYDSYLTNNIGNIMMARNGNGVTFLHYIAAYASDDRIDFAFYLIYNVKNMTEEVDMINIKDNNGMTPVHWAAQKRNDPEVVQTLAKGKMDLQGEDNKRSTPLTLALIHQNLSFAEALLNFLGTRLTHEQWTKNWDDKVKEILMASDEALLSQLKAHAQLKRKMGEKMPVSEKELLDGIPVIWTALYAGGEGIVKLIQKSNKDAVNQKDEIGRTALHWATILQQRDVVFSLCRRKELQEHMLANVEDKFGKIALQYAMEMENEEITSELMLTRGVQSWLDRMYQDRQVHVDAANAILVGAALIASVTFAGWLQPPLGNDLSKSYLQHIAVRIFWAFNSLSFYFAIATVLAGAGTVIPMSGVHIGKAVQIIKFNLFFVAVLFAISIVCVLGAFAAAGFAVLPSSPKYRGNMMGTTSLGVLVCFLILCWFFYRLRSFRIRQKGTVANNLRHSKNFDAKRIKEMYQRDVRIKEMHQRDVRAEAVAKIEIDHPAGEVVAEIEIDHPADEVRAVENDHLSDEVRAEIVLEVAPANLEEDEKEYEDGPSTSKTCI